MFQCAYGDFVGLLTQHVSTFCNYFAYRWRKNYGGRIGKRGETCYMFFMFLMKEEGESRMNYRDENEEKTAI